MTEAILLTEENSPSARSSSSQSNLAVLVIIVVLILGGVLRWFDFPGRYEIRDGDELGYLSGGLALIEGIAPGFKAAPAGPQFWAEWAYVGSHAVAKFIRPDPRARHVPIQVRPFITLDDALFDSYRDSSGMHRWIVGLNDGLALLGCIAAASLGIRFSGWIGGLLLGGLFASWPLFVAFSEQSRPYAQAWAFGIIAMCFAAGAPPWSERKRSAQLWFAAISLGLAIGSRIDMLTLFPLLWWIYLDQQPPGRRVARLFLASLLAGAVAIFVAPWLITSLAGELRTIATVRFAATPAGHVPWSTTLIDYLGPQGAAVPTVIALIAIFIQPPGRRLRCGILALFWAMLFASLLKERGFGLHQHAEVFLVLLVLLAATLRPMLIRWPRIVLASALVAIVIPTALSARATVTTQSAYEHDEVVPWIEHHVPAGTTVYLCGWMTPNLLPTPECSQSLWNEVTDEQAWQKKFESGLARFGLKSSNLPRALSEENLVQERGNRRGWFILGGHTDLPNPRYDIRPVRHSLIFGVQDLPAALKEKSGIVIWRTCDTPPPTELGSAVAQWLDHAGNGVLLFSSPDVRSLLHP